MLWNPIPHKFCSSLHIAIAHRMQTQHNRRKFSRLGILLLNVCITNPSHLINRTLKLCALGTILFYQINFSKLFSVLNLCFYRGILFPAFEMKIYCLKCAELTDNNKGKIYKINLEAFIITNCLL